LYAAVDKGKDSFFILSWIFFPVVALLLSNRQSIPFYG
jgi:hypothetical protein